MKPLAWAWSNRRFQALGIGCAAAVTAGVIVLSQHGASAETPSASFVLRGSPADPNTFSLSTLQSPSDRLLLDTTRDRVFSACMKKEGFSKPPDGGEDDTSDYAQKYGQAANGDDGSNASPPAAKVVKLPGGEQSDVSVSWTPASCIYQSYAKLGSDPIYREALRLRMMILTQRADSSATQNLTDETAQWEACSNVPEGNGFDLLRAVDGSDVRPGTAAMGQTATCLTPDLVAKVQRVRATYNLQVATANSSVVDAWVNLVDHEVSVAEGLNGQS